MEEHELQHVLSLYSQETKRVELAYEALQNQFFALKERLENSHQTLEQIISYLTEGLLLVGENGLITLVNTAAEELLGISSKRILQRLFWDHFTDRFFGFSMQEALKEPGSHKRVFLNLDSEREIEVSTSSIPQKGLLLLLSNRKERAALERSLNQTERLQELGEMAATLAHEIRNPLGGIEGFAQLLKRDIEKQDHMRMIQAILEGTKTINHLVTLVLDYAKPLHLHFAPTELVSLIEESIALATVAKQGSPYQFVTDYKSYPLLADAHQIKLVLLNLLRNAFEANASQIEIHLKGKGTIVVKDNGEGIEAKNLKKIFTPFFTTKTNGTGLGLAQAAAIVKAHGGTFEVASVQGQGAQFTLTLPG